jgi:tRNA-dihydrouridine synthase B
MLAPMAGVTDWVFRQLVQRHSAPSMTVSEMIASQSMVRQIKKTMLRHCQGDEKIAVQLAGNDPEIMAEAARISVDKGACLIDINMGCPVKKIAVNSYAGSALMKDLDLAAKIFRAIVKAVPVPVTVKMRKGWDDQHQNAADLIAIAKEEGLAYVTVHGRTRTQLFSGRADWDFIDSLQKNIDFPIIGNGDINTVEDAQRVIQNTAGIMIGRASYGKPWFLGQVRHFLTTGTHKPAPLLAVQKEIAKEHFQSLLTYYGAQQGMLIARKHLSWYSKGLPGAHEFRAQIFQNACPESILNHIEHFYTMAEQGPQTPHRSETSDPDTSELTADTPSCEKTTAKPDAQHHLIGPRATHGFSTP